MANNSTNGCQWPGGQDASNKTVPCIPGAKSSVCCSLNDMCLDSGLCFSQGQVLAYRGACTGNGWRDGTCPDICNDILNFTYGNVMGCPFGYYDAGFKNFWCGSGWTCNETGQHGMFLNLSNGIGNLTNFATGFTSTSLFTSSNSSSSSSTATPSNNDSHIGAIAGGIAGPLGAAAIIFAALYFWERRKRKHDRVDGQYAGGSYHRYELSGRSKRKNWVSRSELGADGARVELPASSFK